MTMQYTHGNATDREPQARAVARPQAQAQALSLSLSQSQQQLQRGHPEHSGIGQPNGLRHSPRRCRRAALSCRECRRRKIKCNQENPCSHCLRHNARCIYQPYADGSEKSRGLDVLHVRSQAPALAASPTPSGNTDRCSPDTSAIGQSHRDSRSVSRGLGLVTVPHVAGAAGAGLPNPTSSSRRGVDQHDQGCGAQGPLLQSVLHQLQILGESVKRAKLLRGPSAAGAGKLHAGRSVSQCAGEHAGEHPDEAPVQDLGEDEGAPKDWKNTLNKSRDLGKGDWTESAQEFAAIIACWGEVMGKSSNNPAFRDPQVAVLIEQAGDFLYKCKHTAKIIKLLRPTRGLTLSSPDWPVPPPRETCDTLVNLYFNSFESAHRILHVPTFWADYRKYWDSPESRIPKRCCVTSRSYVRHPYKIEQMIQFGHPKS